MAHIKFDFGVDPRTKNFMLKQEVSPTFRVIVGEWSKASHSRQSALKRADRFVGEAVRNSDAGTQFTYTKETCNPLDPTGSS